MDGHSEDSRVRSRSVGRLYRGRRHCWELRKHGRAHRGVLALETLLQSKKIEPARFEPIEQATLIWRGKARWQSEAFAQSHVCFRFHSQNFVQTKPLSFKLLLECKHGGARILAGRFNRR